MKKAIKILIVDDLAVMRHMTRQMSRDLGYQHLHEANDGSTALPLLQNGRFETIFARLHAAA